MQTHPDYEHEQARLFDRLRAEADRMMEARESDITAGTPGEEPMREWESYGVHCRELPERDVDAPLDLVRVSIGGIEAGSDRMAYCVFRGPLPEVKAVLRRALNALKRAP